MTFGKLDEGLAEADNLAIALSLTEDTDGLIDARQLGHVKPSAYFQCGG